MRNIRVKIVIFGEPEPNGDLKVMSMPPRRGLYLSVTKLRTYWSQLTQMGELYYTEKSSCIITKFTIG